MGSYVPHQAENNLSPAVTVPEAASALWGLCDATEGLVILALGSIGSIPVVLDLVQEGHYRVYVVAQKPEGDCHAGRSACKPDGTLTIIV